MCVSVQAYAHGELSNNVVWVDGDVMPRCREKTIDDSLRAVAGARERYRQRFL